MAYYLSREDFWKCVRAARKSAEWLRSNCSLFAGSITEPLCIDLNDNELNERLQDYLDRESDERDDDEDIRDLAMFTFSDKSDLIKFDDMLYEIMNMRVNVGLKPCAYSCNNVLLCVFFQQTSTMNDGYVKHLLLLIQTF
jgi:hypothetical protein